MSALASWVCPYCNARNYRANAGSDTCEACHAATVTADPAFEHDDFRVVQSQPPIGDLSAHPELLLGPSVNAS